ncbi:MAG: YebC/PmpR family DNA-binding transcriptional regulator [Candidatus Roizmanbacteria bacterium]|nr:YebC/PmpR family DNA-binding transcriptional regulator [Candidatus Roizmanbacteria bacterium]
MSGHSKWSTIKRQKGVEDKKRGQLFTKLARAITLAVREGGGVTDPGSNFKLRLAMDRAKQSNMPKENMQRAIDRGGGKGSDGEQFQQIVYEGFGPEGVALIIETATDNKQRTSSQIKHVLDRSGGSLGSPGSVSYLFSEQGLIVVSKESMSEEDLFNLAVEAGASDVETEEDAYEIYTNRDDLHRVKAKLEESSAHIVEADLIHRPTTTVSISQDQKAQKIIALVEELEELDDVQKVYVNVDFVQSGSS